MNKKGLNIAITIALIIFPIGIVSYCIFLSTFNSKESLIINLFFSILIGFGISIVYFLAYYYIFYNFYFKNKEVVLNINKDININDIILKNRGIKKHYKIINDTNDLTECQPIGWKNSIFDNIIIKQDNSTLLINGPKIFIYSILKELRSNDIIDKSLKLIKLALLD